MNSLPPPTRLRYQHQSRCRTPRPALIAPYPLAGMSILDTCLFDAFDGGLLGLEDVGDLVSWTTQQLSVQSPAEEETGPRIAKARRFTDASLSLHCPRESRAEANSPRAPHHRSVCSSLLLRALASTSSRSPTTTAKRRVAPDHTPKLDCAIGCAPCAPLDNHCGVRLAPGQRGAHCRHGLRRHPRVAKN